MTVLASWSGSGGIICAGKNGDILERYVISKVFTACRSVFHILVLVIFDYYFFLHIRILKVYVVKAPFERVQQSVRDDAQERAPDVSSEDECDARDAGPRLQTLDGLVRDSKKNKSKHAKTWTPRIGTSK